jgi:hypothetical protein
MVERYIQVLVGKPDEKRPIGRPRHTLVDNIKTYVKEVGLGHRLD